MKKTSCQSSSVEQTHKIAADLVKSLKKGTVVLLKGNLGSGKTTFTQGLAKALGIKKRITSPTFLLMKVYPSKHKKIKQLVHLDLYRLDEVVEFGLEDYLNEESLVVIEWPEKIDSELPKDRIEIEFKNISEDKRKVNIKK